MILRIYEAMLFVSFWLNRQSEERLALNTKLPLTGAISYRPGRWPACFFLPEHYLFVSNFFLCVFLNATSYSVHFFFLFILMFQSIYLFSFKKKCRIHWKKECLATYGIWERTFDLSMNILILKSCWIVMNVLSFENKRQSLHI